jgi:hypothetical protein
MSEPTMNITLPEAQDIVQWMGVAADNGQGPEGWAFAERLIEAFPTLDVPAWLRKPEPPPPPPPACPCGSNAHGPRVATCIQFDYPQERR